MLLRLIKKHPFSVMALILGVIVGINVQIYIYKHFPNKNESKINQVYKLTTAYYFDDVDSTKLVEDAINGMFSHLDPHTTYLPEEDEKISEDSFRGEFDGIGVEFQIIKDTITVVSPISGGPSQKAGILPGDKIVAIEGKSAIGITNKEVIEQLRGEKGSIAEFTVYRALTKNKYNYKIKRDRIPINSVDVSLLFDKDIAYVNLTRFAETSTVEISKALARLKLEGMKKIILDLRNNPGGLLNEAVSIADLFLDDSKLIVYTKGRISDFDAEYFADRLKGYEDYPLIVLINQGSASASEIVSGAIQDWDRGLIVGSTSFGKGLVQRPFLLSDGSAVRITVSRYFTPSGRAIQRDYSKGKDAYYLTVYANPDSNKIDSSKIKFKTKGGRTVYGGGGITPDVQVKYGDLSNFAIELTRNNIYYQFIRKHLDENKKSIVKKYSKLSDFVNSFSMKNEEKSFIKFAENNGVKYSRSDYIKDRDYILQRLKAYVAREIWGNEGWYNIMLRSDIQFLKAVELFKNQLKTNRVIDNGK